MQTTPPRTIELPTLALFLGCYAFLLCAVFILPDVWLPLAIAALGIALAHHSSCQHEALHGHPTRSAIINEILVFPAVGLFVPYRRFRDLHLLHHSDETLTDPYDDPETNYLDPVVWARLPGWLHQVLRFNNTLAGRMLIGPVISNFLLIRGDLRLIRAGDNAVVSAWGLHLIGLAPVIWVVHMSPMPVWGWVTAAYLGLSLLKIRTFLEHRADPNALHRTVVIEDRGFLAWLFLNNNFHAVHHSLPHMPWYRLPARYFAEPDRYHRQNGGYVYRSYAEIFRRHFFSAKDPVPHPLRDHDITQA